MVYVVLTIIWFVSLGLAGWYFGYNQLNKKNQEVQASNDPKNTETKEEEKSTEDVNKEETIPEVTEAEEVKVEEVQDSEVATSQQDIYYANPSDQIEETDEAVHNHTWVDITEEIYHEEVGHFEDVLVSPELIKVVPIYATKEMLICNGCGANITINPMAHIEGRKVSGYLECNGYHTEWRDEQIDTRQEVTPAVYNKVWKVDKKAWTETKVVGKECTTCGETY